MKKVVILKSGGGELANQLWNYVSVYAYGLYSGVTVENPSFFEYHRYFTLWEKEGFVSRFFSFWFQGKIRRRSHPINQFWRRVYSLYVRIVRSAHFSLLYSSENSESTVTYLPPTTFPSPILEKDTVYLEGWLFRNPKGLTQYRNELLKAFRPTTVIQHTIDSTIEKFRSNKTTVLLGIHLRQGDYKIFKNGKYLISPERMREILDEYVADRNLIPENVTLYIASDGPVPANVFSKYTTFISKENAVIDLFTLSRMDTILGSDSSFGHFASWYGNIPHIVATKEPIDWNYYSGKKTYFQNIYCTLAQF